MKEILIGVVSGVFSGIGMGGGTVLIILLTTLVGLEQHIAQATNLIYFIPTAISAIIVNYKEKNIDIELVKTFSIFGSIGSFIGAIISINTNVFLLKKCYGIFLLIIAVYEIYTLFREYKLCRRRNTKNN